MRPISSQERGQLVGMGIVVLALHAIGLFILLVFVLPRHHGLGTSSAFGLGIGVSAYTLGLRHAFDADHIGAIDNTTRKLMNDGQRPVSVGFFFSLGHSTIVFVLAVLVTIGVHGISGAIQDDGSTLHEATGLIGPIVSGTFLVGIGLLNLIILFSIIKVFRRMRRGSFDEAELQRQLEHRGLLNRFYGRASRAVRKPWHMYPLGCLFGLGFDTATEIALLVLAGGAAASGLPFYAVMCLAVLFAAGMCLCDTLDGTFMTFAYGWAFARPVRKIFYNIAITALSVAVALVIGTIELLAVLAEKLQLTGPIWDLVSKVDLNVLGYLIISLFLLTWAIALAAWRLLRLEDRWSAGLPAQAPPP